MTEASIFRALAERLGPHQLSNSWPHIEVQKISENYNKLIFSDNSVLYVTSNGTIIDPEKLAEQHAQAALWPSIWRWLLATPVANWPVEWRDALATERSANPLAASVLEQFLK